MPKRVLITGARAPAALDLARSFAVAGYEVHMADCAPSKMAALSRAVTDFHRFPPPRGTFSEFKEAITKLIAALNPAIVIPTCEEVFYLAALGNERVFAPDSPTLRRLHSKHLFPQAAARIGLAVPETRLIRTAADLAPILAGAEDLVLKPEFSRFGKRTLVGPSREVIAALRPSETAAWVAQRRVRGAEVSFYAISNESRLVAFSAYGSPWKFEGGAGYAFESLERPMHDRLLHVAERLARNLVPFGQFACDVIVDGDGTAWLLECNPRATSGIHMFGRSAGLVEAIFGQRKAPLLAADASPRHVGPALWIYGLPEALRHRRLAEWMLRHKQSDDVISAPGDPAPVFGALIDAARLGVKAAVRGLSLTAASTMEIEWNGEAL